MSSREVKTNKRRSERGYQFFPQASVAACSQVRRTVLGYFAICQEEVASRTIFRSMLMAFAFFLEAGEVPKQDRHSSVPALAGALKEHETKWRFKA